MNNGKNFVLITGATSGIGLALASRFAINGYPLVFVARNQDKLENHAATIRQKYKVDVITIAQDLCGENAAGNIFRKVNELGVKVGILINNAGFNEAGRFEDTDLNREIDLVRVHIIAVLELSKLFLPDMKKNKYGRIVNVCSTGAFLPVPNNAVYCAAKTFLYNFSNAVRFELRKKGVKVTALCPGATLTNFPLEAEISETRLFKIFPMKPESVAKKAFRGILKGKRKIIPGLYNKILVASLGFTPRWIKNPVSDWMYKSKKK